MNLPNITLPQVSLPDLSGNKKFILLGVVAVVAVLLVGLMLSLTLFRKVAPVTLTFWGLWEDQGVYGDVVADYQKKNPNVTIRYSKMSPINYGDRLTTALGGDSAPDIFFIHNSWLPAYLPKLDPMPTTAYSPTEYKTVFYPTVSRDFIAGGKAYAVPLGIDNLAMYVNSDILTAAGVSVPTTWDGSEGFLAVAKKMTVRDTNGRIRTAGAAMGTASNVDHWQDILTLMMIQSGVDLNHDPGSQKAQDALSFYTTFATTEKIWDETLDNSTAAFAAGKVGMYFAPSWRFFDLKVMNPNLNFKVVPVPQLTGADTFNEASYWAAAVGAKSANKKMAWDFLKFASSKEELTKTYTAAAKTRAFGQPYPRVEMANLLANDPNVAPFINAAPTAKGWFLASFTSDGQTGINSQIGAYYKTAIDAMLRGADAKSALETVAKGVAQVLGTYSGK
ncbi:extracellular solute-binding protein [Candidatus Microgenomates bacterium]|nr:extracellular solute-binding protein [Candidatus Microgenomates bacterium]